MVRSPSLYRPTASRWRCPLKCTAIPASRAARDASVPGFASENFVIRKGRVGHHECRWCNRRLDNVRKTSSFLLADFARSVTSLSNRRACACGRLSCSTRYRLIRENRHSVSGGKHWYRETKSKAPQSARQGRRRPARPPRLRRQLSRSRASGGRGSHRFRRVFPNADRWSQA